MSGHKIVGYLNKATSRIGREYGSLPLVSIVLTHSEGEGVGCTCHTGEEEH